MTNKQGEKKVKKQFGVLCLNISLVVLGVYFVYMPGDANAGTITCCASCESPDVAECDDISGNVNVDEGGEYSCRLKKSDGSMCTYYYKCRIEQAGGRYDGIWGYTSECSTTTWCTNGQTVSCSGNGIASGKKTCKDGDWSRCVPSSCSSGYVKINNECWKTCTMANGSGYLNKYQQATSGGDSGNDDEDDTESSSSSSSSEE